MADARHSEARTLRNEVGDDITVRRGDIVTMRSGNQYLMVEVPVGGASGPADWPTGYGVRRNGEGGDVMLDRIHQVTPGTPASRAAADTLLNVTPDRARNEINGAFRSARASGQGTASGFAAGDSDGPARPATNSARGASAPNAAGTGNS